MEKCNFSFFHCLFLFCFVLFSGKNEKLRELVTDRQKTFSPNTQISVGASRDNFL